MFEELYRNAARDAQAIIDAIEDAIEDGDLGAPGGAGSDQEILYNAAGIIESDAFFKRDYSTGQIYVGDPASTAMITINPTNADYQDVMFGGTIDSSLNYIPVSDNFGYLWNQPSNERLGVELVYDETPGGSAAFNKGVGYQLATPNSSNDPRAFIIYQYGGVGTGASATGMGVLVDNNTAGSGAAAWLGLKNKSATPYYTWPDANGVWRFHTARPTESGSVSDTVLPTSGGLSAYNGYFQNRVGIQTEAPTEPLHIKSGTTTSAGMVRLDMYDSSAAAGGNIFMRHARGTVGAETQILANDVLGGLFGSGWHSGGNFSTNNVASIRMLAFENFTSTNQGTYIDFATTSGGGVARTVKWYIGDTGHFISNNGTEMIKWGTTSSYPALKRSSAQLEVRLGDDSAYAFLRGGGFGVNTNANGTDLVNVSGGSDTAPRVKVYNTTTTQFSTAGMVFGNQETASGHEEWHFYGEKSSSGSATGTSSFQIRRRNPAQSEATTHMIIDGSGNVYFNAGFTAGSGSSLQGNVGIKQASPAVELEMSSTSTLGWNGRSRIDSTGSGLLVLYNNTESSFERLMFGGTTSSFPSIKRSSAILQARLADDSAFTDVQMDEVITNSTAFMHRTSASLTNGAGASSGTLTNAPSAGNPTKWIPIDDNGTTRYIPAW